MDKPIDDATWEHEHTLKAQFPHFILQECNILKQGSMLYTQNVGEGRSIIFT